VHTAGGESAPSLEEWKALYQAAKEFHALAPWRWMWDSDLFGVQDPVTGEITYACVLGNGGEVFALVGYLGSEGLAVYNEILFEEIYPESPEAITAQRCLIASFEDRAEIGKEDYRIIRQLGLRFRGRNAWPLFRSYRPGFFPWYLTAQEARSLTVTLEQAVEVAQRMRDTPDLLLTPEEDLYLVRVPQDREGTCWRDEWHTPAPYEKPELPLPHLPTTALKRLRESPTPRRGTWEIATFLLPAAVEQEGDGPPFFPAALLVVEHKTGIVLHMDLSEPWEYLDRLQEQLLAVFKDADSWPRALWVVQEDLQRILLPLAEQLSIELCKVQRLPALEEARESLFDYLDPGSGGVG
jgi:hypothetical protein